MLAKQYRINTPFDFRHIMRKGTRVMSVPGVKIFIRPNLLGHNRFGFVVSKKVGNSVVRHRVTRVLRDAVRTHVDAGSSDFIILALPEFNSAFKVEKLIRVINR